MPTSRLQLASASPNLDLSRSHVSRFLSSLFVLRSSFFAPSSVAAPESQPQPRQQDVPCFVLIRLSCSLLLFPDSKHHALILIRRGLNRLLLAKRILAFNPGHDLIGADWGLPYPTVLIVSLKTGL